MTFGGRCVVSRGRPLPAATCLTQRARINQINAMEKKQQHIWTPDDAHILQFLIDKQSEGYRIVSVSPHVKKWFNGYGVEQHKLVGYIVIGEGGHPPAEGA